MNKIYLMGKVGSEPKTGSTNSGTTWANFRIAVSKKNKDGQWESQFFTVAGFGKTAEEIKNLRKGFKVFVEGELQIRQYEKDNVKKEQYQVFAYGVLGQPKYNDAVSGANDFDPGFDGSSGDDIGF